MWQPLTVFITDNDLFPRLVFGHWCVFRCFFCYQALSYFLSWLRSHSCRLGRTEFGESLCCCSVCHWADHLPLSSRFRFGTRGDIGWHDNVSDEAGVHVGLVEWYDICVLCRCTLVSHSYPCQYLINTIVFSYSALSWHLHMYWG